MKDKKIVVVGCGVAGMYAITKLIKGGYPPNLITAIDAGKDPYLRPKDEVMKGAFGAGLFSDGKWVYLHNAIGGQLAKYTGEEKADQLIEEGLDILKLFHPDPSKIMFSNPVKEPEFIKPYFNLRMAPTYHIGTDYLHEMGKRWYDWLVEKGVHFEWEKEIYDIDFHSQFIRGKDKYQQEIRLSFDKLIYGTGKSGIDLTQNLIDKYELKKEPKSVQIGVRFEAPQKYFQKILDISYDFKLYQKPNNKVSLRTFCTNSGGAYIAEETTYGMKSYNGHSFKDPSMDTGMVNFGIIMEIKGIDNPFEFQKEIVKRCQIKNKGLYYSPGDRPPSLSAEGEKLNVEPISWLSLLEVDEVYNGYFEYITNFISDLKKVFNFEDDYGIYIPEVKFLSEEVLVNYESLALVDYPHIQFIGDSLSSRGIAVSAAHGILAAEHLLKI